MRNKSIDTIQGILVFYMIVFHLFLQKQDWFWNGWNIMFFFMPFFFFKAGMFFRKKPIRDQIRISFRRLIVPYIFFSLVGYCVFLIKPIRNHDIHINILYRPFETFINYGVIWGNVCWFLLTLFIVRLFFNFVNTKYIKYLIPFAVTFSMTLCYEDRIWVPQYVENSCLGASFFGVGYIYANSYYNQERTSKYVFIIALLLYSVGLWIYPSYVEAIDNKLYFGNYLVWWIAAICGCILMIKLLQNKTIPLFDHIGRHSMVYYLMHIPIINLTDLIISPTGVSSFTRNIICSISLCFLLPLFDNLFRSRRMRWSIGEP